jgi:hypothetical protein
MQRWPDVSNEVAANLNAAKANVATTSIKVASANVANLLSVRPAQQHRQCTEYRLMRCVAFQ